MESPHITERKTPRRFLAYLLFAATVFLVLSLVRPKPDLIPFDYTSIASSYSGLLSGLGGFAITVLAVLLGLEAIDVEKNSETTKVVHHAAVRHVAVSLAAACVACFVGANMLGEVSALSASIERDKTTVREQIETHLQAAGLDDAQIASSKLTLGPGPQESTFFAPTQRVQALVEQLKREKTAKHESAVSALASKAKAYDRVLDASPRRHFVVASFPAFLSSFLILQSLSYLLVLRFPGHSVISRFQFGVVLTVSGVLLVKLLYITSYGLMFAESLVFHGVLFALLVGLATAYGVKLQRDLVRLKHGRDLPAVAKFTPLLPYLIGLGCCVLCNGVLAATYSDYHPLTWLDRGIVGFATILTTSALLAIQMERPTIEMLRELGDQTESDGVEASFL